MATMKTMSIEGIIDGVEWAYPAPVPGPLPVRKHKKDYNHCKCGMHTGNPRYGKARGFERGRRAADKIVVRKMLGK